MNQEESGWSRTGGNEHRTFNIEHPTLNHSLEPETRNLKPETSSRHTRWLSCFLIDELKFGMSRLELVRFLDAANVEARPVWKPMHTQKLYQGYECIGGAVAEDLNRRGICLPSSSSLSEADQQFVIETVRRAHFLRKRK
ncbi:MAG: DegT/DnrJ/EryC1/StrS family aminotransferase [Limisphaerales bacterium]